MTPAPHGRVLGADLSPTGAALVGIEDGRVAFRRVCTDIKALAGAFPAEALLLEATSPVTDACRLERLARVTAWLAAAVAAFRPGLVCLEDYAGSGKATGATLYYQGEVAGPFRLAVARAGVPLRLYAASHLKIYATGSGNADKVAMGVALFEWQGLNFGDYRRSAENLIDAAWLAYMGEAELLLRANAAPPRRVGKHLRALTAKTPKQAPYVERPFLALPPALRYPGRREERP